MPQAPLFRRVSVPVLLALTIGSGAVALNVLLARQLAAIERDAQTIVESWIARSSALATFEDGIREFRRQEALFALSDAGSPAATRAAVALDSLQQQTDSTLSHLLQLDGAASDSTGSASLRPLWGGYRALYERDATLARGVNSPTLQAFRDREPDYQRLESQVRAAQKLMREGTEGVAIRSARSTRASRALMLVRLLLVLATIGFAELVRRSWKERADAERALAQAERALSQGKRIEAVGTLAGGVAHDLNNVLTAVNGYAQLAKADLPPGHPVRDDLDAITAASDRGAALVRRVLQFARQRPAPQQAVEVAELIHEVAQLLRPQLPPHVRVVLQLPDAPCHVRADPTELHQVIVNIASNALHAMETHGTTLTFALSQDDGSVHLVVSDDGVGMPPEVLDRAIEPFFTTREVGDGTGLGLAVVHGVITSLGGTLTLSSVPGAGTTVRVTLPRAAASADGSAELTTHSAVATDVSLRVLLVDDDPQVRHAIARLLEQAGHRVESFAAAPPALEALQADGDRADVILTDLTMPLMNGLELAERLRVLPAMPPVVLISGYLDISTSQRARTLGIAALLDKPVDADDLLRVLSEVTQQRLRTPREP